MTLESIVVPNDTFKYGSERVTILFLRFHGISSEGKLGTSSADGIPYTDDVSQGRRLEPPPSFLRIDRRKFATYNVLAKFFRPIVLDFSHFTHFGQESLKLINISKSFSEAVFVLLIVYKVTDVIQ